MNISLSFHYQKTLCLSLSPMALSDKSSRQSLIPSFLYSSSSTVSTSHKSFGLDKTMLGAAAPASSNNGVSSPTRNFIVRAARSRRTRRPSTPPYRRRYSQLWSHSYGRHSSRSRQVQYAGPILLDLALFHFQLLFLQFDSTLHFFTRIRSVCISIYLCVFTLSWSPC